MLALVMAAALGPALDNTIVAIAIPLIPYTARVIRSNTLALREQPFVEAARAVGMSEFRIAVRHVLPNTLAPLIVHRHRAARRGDPDRSVALVPRPRRAGAASVLGPHAVGIGRRIRAHRALAGDLPRPRHQPRRVRHQSVRRCVARHPRSAAARLMTQCIARRRDTAATERPSRCSRSTDLRTYFDLRHGVVKAVDGVSFSLAPHETLAIVGESGCGKSITALSLMRLVPDPPGRIAGGAVKLDGVDLLALDEATMRAVRGKDIAMIFQEPMTSLNPVLTIGSQIAEALLLHEKRRPRREALGTRPSTCCAWRASPSRSSAPKEYPHQLSGGMRQRAMIAMALACNPKVLIADEPTTALDVTIQAQILDIILDLQKKLGTAVILITHDLGVVAETAQRVIVMYAGRKVEEAPVERTVRAPAASLYARPDGLDPAAAADARRGGRTRASGCRKFPASCRR